MEIWKTKMISAVALALAIGTVVYTNNTPQTNGQQVAVVTSSTSTNADPIMRSPITMTYPLINTTPKPTPTSQPNPTLVTPAVVVPKSKYRDGTYTAVGPYFVPEGSESITVIVTLQNDIITSADVTGNATRGDSRKYMNRFISGYSSYVVGKNVDDVHLTRVSGSSLTPHGFNAALAIIKSQAA